MANIEVRSIEGLAGTGVPYAYALLRHGRRIGNAAYVAAAEAVLDHVAANLAPGGTFWAQWTASRGWTTGWL